MQAVTRFMRRARPWSGPGRAWTSLRAGAAMAATRAIALAVSEVTAHR
jgi:hypothetical protein